MNTKQIACSPHSGDKLVCPWQLAPIIDNFLRPIIHNPHRLFKPYVRYGMTVLDVGCGAGFASLGLADLVGEEGLVISADLQQKMLDMVKKRAEKAGFGNRVRTHRCEPDRIGLKAVLDFALAFFMLHEVPDERAFLEEMYGLFRNGGLFFLTEPKVHVTGRKFEESIKTARSIGFTEIRRPAVRLGRAVLLMKGEDYLSP